MLFVLPLGALAFRAAPARLPSLSSSSNRVPQHPVALLEPAAATWAVGAASSLLADVAPAAVAEPGWFDYVVVFPFETAITSLHDALKGAGIEEAYGPSIIMFTIALKLVTLPLNKQQIESTTKMQAIAPAAKALQDKYRDRDPARLNQELQKLYADNQVNPLAGCLPAFAQIPLFIGLYRSLLNLAKEDKLTESFLFLPSLEGPNQDYTQGIGWLTEWVNGAPKYGWHDTLCYLVLPVLLVVSQYISTAILTPKSDDPAQQQSQAILKFLPLMIGWFSLSVPSGLGLYWMTNNLVTTLSTVAIRQSVQTPELAGVGAPARAVDPPKAQGFGGRRFGEVIESTENSGTKVTITPPGAAMATPTRAERRAASVMPAEAVVDAQVVGESAAPMPEASVLAADMGVPAAAAEGAKKKPKKKRSKKNKK